MKLKKQFGKVEAAVVALVSVLVLVVAALAICAVGYIGAQNYGVSTEASLKTQKEKNEVLLADYGKQLAEMAQVPENARDDIVKIARASIEGRYGPNGSQAAVSMISERNPSIDPAMYRRIQQLIQSGRDSFQQGQTKMLDIKRGYESNLGYFWRGTWLRVAGFPRLNLEDYKAVTSDRASTAFKTGKEEAIQMRK